MRDEAARVGSAIERLQIDTRAQGEVRRLSGGNQQKVTIARWIARGVDTLLLFDPTRGIDIRTKRQIYALVRDLADQGAAVLFYTSELAEVRLACDRAVVIFDGRVVDVIDAADADEPTLMRAAYGLTESPVPGHEADTRAQRLDGRPGGAAGAAAGADQADPARFRVLPGSTALPAPRCPLRWRPWAWRWWSSRAGSTCPSPR